MKKSKNNRKGFTLVELLAVIMILSIISVVTIAITNGSIGNAKEKSYQITINNIKKAASGYLNERSTEIEFIPVYEGSSQEFQCVTIQQLMDLGYFDVDVLGSPVKESEDCDDGICKVSKTDLVVLIRDVNTKTLTDSEYVRQNEDYSTMCAVAQARGYIDITVSPIGWSKSKEVTINYKVKNVGSNNSYTKIYTYTSDITHQVVKNETVSGDTTKFNVSENGEVYAYISGHDISKTRKITKIDNEGPVLKSEYTGDRYVSKSVTIPINANDLGVGFDSTSFTKDDLVVKIGGTSVLSANLTLRSIVTNELDSSQDTENSTIDGINYALTIDNSNLSGEVVIEISQNKVTDLLGNGNAYIKITPNVIFDNVRPVVNYGTITGNLEELVVNFDLTDELSGLNESKIRVASRIFPRVYYQENNQTKYAGVSFEDKSVECNKISSLKYSCKATFKNIEVSHSGTLSIYIYPLSVYDNAGNFNLVCTKDFGSVNANNVSSDVTLLANTSSKITTGTKFETEYGDSSTSADTVDDDKSKLYEVKLPVSMEYIFQVWGAQGGRSAYSAEGSTLRGGYGAFATGVKDINIDEISTLYVYPGGRGLYGTCAKYGACKYASYGGKNGGGGFYLYYGNLGASTGAGGGGGATHIATQSGELSSLSDSRESVLIVAAGGGGGAYAYEGSYSDCACDSYCAQKGGHGGGYRGNTGGGWCTGYGARQYSTVRNACSSYYTEFGQGGSTIGNWDSYYYAGGGGGGYYGGGAGWGTQNIPAGGGGGSSYIGGMDLSDDARSSNYMACYNCYTSTDSNETYTKSVENVSAAPTVGYAKKNNGYARITADNGQGSYYVNGFWHDTKTTQNNEVNFVIEGRSDIAKENIKCDNSATISVTTESGNTKVTITTEEDNICRLYKE